MKSAWATSPVPHRARSAARPTPAPDSTRPARTGPIPAERPPSRHAPLPRWPRSPSSACRSGRTATRSSAAPPVGRRSSNTSASAAAGVRRGPQVRRHLPGDGDGAGRRAPAVRPGPATRTTAGSGARPRRDGGRPGAGRSRIRSFHHRQGRPLADRAVDRRRQADHRGGVTQGRGRRAGHPPGRSETGPAAGSGHPNTPAPPVETAGTRSGPGPGPGRRTGPPRWVCTSRSRPTREVVTERPDHRQPLLPQPGVTGRDRSAAAGQESGPLRVWPARANRWAAPTSRSGPAWPTRRSARSAMTAQLDRRPGCPPRSGAAAARTTASPTRGTPPPAGRSGPAHSSRSVGSWAREDSSER